MPIDLNKLNKEQREAVLHGEGPLLIVAGAGTGKTTVITQRIVNLIEKGLAKPEEILAVTFTEKAATEMEERVDMLVDIGYLDLWVSTFHSFAERVLRENALDIGLSPDFKILDETSAWLLTRRNLDRFTLNYYKALSNPTKFIQALISHFSHCKDQEIYPQDYLNYAHQIKTRDDCPENQEIERIKEIANAFYTYQQILLENNALDFGDLINYCLKLFKERPLILKKYREKFKFILVDEFQDTNWAQYELIKLIAAPLNNLTVCADDDQAIYRWRGASFSNIIQFTKDFPNAKQVSLIRNYRSCQNILDLAYKFIKQNDPNRLESLNQISKRLISESKEKGIIEHIHAPTLEQEVSETLKKIVQILKEDKDATYSDIAILVRANNHAIPFIKALESANLPYQFLASKGLYSKPVILDVISYFKLLDNYHESSALYRILNLPFLEIDAQDIAYIIEYSRKYTKSLFETINELSLIPKISQASQEKINFLLSLIKKHTQLAREKPVSEIFTAFLEDSGYLKYLAKNELESSIDLLNQFYRKIKKFEETSLDPSLKSFMEEMNLELEIGEEGGLDFNPEEGPDMIKVMTIHGAKGLEFKYVFLANMVDKRFPTIERKGPIEIPDALIKDIKPTGDIHLQEERRLCYVAMTRAKKGLYFTSAEDYGGQKKKKLSRFLLEMNFKPLAKVSERTNNLLLKREKITQKLIKKVETWALPPHFSYTQLAAFEKCPLQYKFAFILKIPIKGKPSFSFGKTMHQTLYEFLTLFHKNKSLTQNSLFGEKGEVENNSFNFDLESFNKIYEKNWIDEWYDSKKQKEEYYKIGKKIIKEFYENLKNNPPQLLEINKEPALEVSFNFKIKNYTICGKIDRIDIAPDTNGVVLIDYKTGQKKEKLDFEAKEQLLIYQMAAKEVLHLEPVLLSYHYLEESKISSFLGSENEIAALKEKIIETIEKIKYSDFQATPGWHCQFCDFKDICDFAEN